MSSLETQSIFLHYDCIFASRYPPRTLVMISVVVLLERHGNFIKFRKHPPVLLCIVPLITWPSEIQTWLHTI